MTADSADGVQPAEDTEITVSIGWCGGMGEAVLAPPAYTDIRFFRNLPVFVTGSRIGDSVREYRERRMRDTGSLSSASIPAPARIRIRGCIRLVKRTERNTSIPGAPLQSFWDARIERLDGLEFCND